MTTQAEIENAELQLAKMKQAYKENGEQIARVTAIHEATAKMIEETTIKLANLRLQAGK